MNNKPFSDLSLRGFLLGAVLLLLFSVLWGLMPQGRSGGQMFLIKTFKVGAIFTGDQQGKRGVMVVLKIEHIEKRVSYGTFLKSPKIKANSV